VNVSQKEKSITGGREFLEELSPKAKEGSKRKSSPLHREGKGCSFSTRKKEDVRRTGKCSHLSRHTEEKGNHPFHLLLASSGGGKDSMREYLVLDYWKGDGGSIPSTKGKRRAQLEASFLLIEKRRTFSEEDRVRPYPSPRRGGISLLFGRKRPSSRRQRKSIARRERG